MTNATNPINSQGPYIRTSRNFPQEAQPLSVEINRSYLDVASHINMRTIGIFPTQKSSVTGESWYLSGPTKSQTLRQVYRVSGAGNIPHMINFADIQGFTKIYGTFTNGTNWYPIPYVDAAAATNQVAILLDPTNIVITAGAGAPTIVSGFVVLEWLSNPSERTTV